MTPEPKITELVDVGGRAISGQGAREADLTRGSDYDSILGPSAVIWTREDRRDQDLFDSTKFHTAKGDDLTFLVKQRYGIDRLLDTNGTGTAVLSRPTAGTAGTVWRGTRITIFGGSPKYYRTTEDVAVTTAEASVTVDIEAILPGPGSKASETSDLRLDDSLWDATWTVSSLECSDGSTYEQASDLIARVRKTRLDQRVGHVKAIEAVCKSAGASQVAVFRSDYGGAAGDGGLNVIYVGDLGYQGSAALQRACFIALREARVLGDHMQVLQMTRTVLNPSIDVYLATAPALNDIERLQQIHHSSVIHHLGGSSGGFTFTRIGILSALARPTPEVQRATIVTPSADVSIQVNGNFPATLNRYVVGSVSLRYHGP